MNWLNGGASFRWSFGPLFAWVSIESTTILTTHPSLLVTESGWHQSEKMQNNSNYIKLFAYLVWIWTVVIYPKNPRKILDNLRFLNIQLETLNTVRRVRLDSLSTLFHPSIWFLFQQWDIIKQNVSKTKKCSATGNRTPVSRVTGGDTHHYTIVEVIIDSNACYINSQSEMPRFQ